MPASIEEFNKAKCMYVSLCLSVYVSVSLSVSVSVSVAVAVSVFVSVSVSVYMSVCLGGCGKERVCVCAEIVRECVGTHARAGCLPSTMLLQQLVLFVCLFVCECVLYAPCMPARACVRDVTP